MKPCSDCPQTPKIEHCQSCYLAEKTRRKRLEKELAEFLYYLDEIMDKVKEI